MRRGLSRALELQALNGSEIDGVSDDDPTSAWHGRSDVEEAMVEERMLTDAMIVADLRAIADETDPDAEAIAGLRAIAAETAEQSE